MHQDLRSHVRCWAAREGRRRGEAVRGTYRKKGIFRLRIMKILGYTAVTLSNVSFVKVVA